MPTQKLVGKSHPRTDGVLKVTGRALYADDIKPANLAYARLVTAPMGPGKIIAIDDADALKTAGVLTVLTHQNIGEEAIRYVKHATAGGYTNSSLRPLASGQISYPGQIVALVVAESLEAASEGATRLRISYEKQTGTYNLVDALESRQLLSQLKPGFKDRARGDVQQGLSLAAHVVEATYQTPIQHHNPIELFTTTCQWQADKLTVNEPARFVGGVQHGLAAQFGIEAKNIRVIARYLGGHFGSKFGLAQYTALAAVASKKLGRPVTIATTRSQCFTIANHRPDTVHKVKLAADPSGRLCAFFHDATCATSRFDTFAMEGTDVTSALYSCQNIQTVEAVAAVDLNTPGPMRAPPEVPYLFALESAMDELAHQSGLDPIELRRVNDTASDPVTGKAFTTRKLLQCFDRAAASFDWQRRKSEPGTNKQGDWLVGLGCASAARPVKIGPATMGIAVETTSGQPSAAPHITIECAHHEIGNGLYTILAMSAADHFNVPIKNVTVHLGDTDLPAAGISGGSATTTSLLNAMAQGVQQLRLQCGLTSGQQFSGQNCQTIVQFVPRTLKADSIDKLRDGRNALSSDPPDKLAWTFGAQFVEVHVHALTGEIKIPRMVACFAAGKIINPLTAHSQATGGMLWGLSSALFEASHIDKQTGKYVNDNLSEYLVPTHADAPDIMAFFIEDEDHEVNPEGIKGLGEIGIIGVNAAIANAVFNATGKRLRSLPIRAQDLI